MSRQPGSISSRVSFRRAAAATSEVVSALPRIRIVLSAKDALVFMVFGAGDGKGGVRRSRDGSRRRTRERLSALRSMRAPRQRNRYRQGSAPRESEARRMRRLPVLGRPGMYRTNPVRESVRSASARGPHGRTRGETEAPMPWSRTRTTDSHTAPTMPDASHLPANRTYRHANERHFVRIAPARWRPDRIREADRLACPSQFPSRARRRRALRALAPAVARQGKCQEQGGGVVTDASMMRSSVVRNGRRASSCAPNGQPVRRRDQGQP